MKPNQIKAKLLLAGVNTIEEAAQQIEEPRAAVSATIHYLRKNTRIRQKLINRYRVRFSDNAPLRQPERKAA